MLRVMTCLQLCILALLALNFLAQIFIWYYPDTQPRSYNNEGKNGLRATPPPSPALTQALTQHTNTPIRTQAPQETQAIPLIQQTQPQKGPVRVGIVVVYVGNALPPWFDAFTHTAAYSAANHDIDNEDVVVFEWLLFVTQIPPRQPPKNVKMIRVTEDELFAHFAQLVDTDVPTEEEFVQFQHDVTANHNKKAMSRSIARLPEPYSGYDTVGVIKHLLTTRSYSMVEFKPTFGYLFADYLASYTHWAYADIDQLLGRLNPLISADILRKHDIYTATFGDNFRLYMRGQLTIHKNTYIPTNILWRGCEHFTNFGDHLVDYLKSGNRSWAFESAEGCYSKVVADAIMNRHPYIPRSADKHSVSVYFGATQATDVFPSPFTDRETILLNKHLMRCYTQPLNPIFTDRSANEDYIEDRQRSRHSEEFAVVDGIETSLVGPTLYTPHVTPQSVPMAKYTCSNWVKPEFQACLDHVPPYADIRAEDKAFRYQDVDRYRAFNNTCRESVISHFQGWKHNYLIHTTRPPPPDTHALVLSEYGFIPYRLADPPKDTDNSKVGSNSHAVKTFGQLLEDSGNAHLSDGTADKITWQLLEQFHEAKTFQMQSSSHTTKPYSLSLVRGDLATGYCGSFHEDLGKCVCSIKYDDVSVLEFAGRYKVPNTEKSMKHESEMVTFITVAWAKDYHSGALDATIEAWGEHGHKVRTQPASLCDTATEYVSIYIRDSLLTVVL
jgi:hypothetical protein